MVLICCGLQPAGALSLGDPEILGGMYLVDASFPALASVRGGRVCVHKLEVVVRLHECSAQSCTKARSSASLGVGYIGARGIPWNQT